MTIPVVIHLVYFNSTQNLTDAQLLSQIDVLNADFRRTNTDASNTPGAFQDEAADCEANLCKMLSVNSGLTTPALHLVPLRIIQLRNRVLRYSRILPVPITPFRFAGTIRK
ncbi:MAG: hypothetical protein ACKVUS_07060 [Saprospiraceae bacterium]